MAAGLPPRETIPPEEKAEIVRRNRGLRLLIDRLQALPDKPTTSAVTTIPATSRVAEANSDG